MNYKKLFRSRKFRIKLLSLFNWIPDKFMISLQYRIYTGRKLNFTTPRRFTEKIQIYKLKYRNPLMLRCTDKYEVRQIIEEIGLGKILIPLIGIYSKPSDINFETLPNEFVAKTTDGGGGNQVFVCHNKSTIKREDFFKRLEEWMVAPKGKHVGREWAYENNFPRRILIEQLIKMGDKKDLSDYKFFCFEGTPYYCQLIENRSTKETIDFYDMEWKHQDFVGLNPFCHNSGVLVPKPGNFDQLKTIAKQLSAGFPFVRVDLYNVDDRVYFGELTFYPASGFGHFSPDQWDKKIGKLFNVDFH